MNADIENESKEYQDFVEKFKPKKTTDDCYTPNAVYNAVKDWAVREYSLSDREIVRPFWPGADYQKVEYQKDCVVIDNPPFSILSQICKYYDSHGIDYFLFAPSLTLFSTNIGRCNYVIIDSDVVYENGARVRTAFVTNLGRYKIHVSPELHFLVKKAAEKQTNELQKYDIPDAVISSARLQKIAKYGIGLRITAEDAVFVRTIDSMRKEGKAIYGGAFLLSEKAAAEKAAAEKAAAEKAAAEKTAAVRWTLSDRERKLQAGLGMMAE